MVKGYLWTITPIIKHNIDLKGEWLKEGNLVEGPIQESRCVEKAQTGEEAVN